jgi:phage terminase large subunit GpA-like protein
MGDHLVTDIVRLYRPPPVLTVSEWADQARKLPERSASRGARYRTDAVPYLREVMDCTLVPGVTRIVLAKSAQCGGSEALHNVIGFHMAHRACPMLLILPTAESAQAASKERIGDLLRGTPALRALVETKRSPGPLREPESTLNLILYKGGYLALGGANSPNAFARWSVRLALGDDVDRWPPTVGEEGDPAELLTNRVTSFHDGRVIFVSTPTMRGGRIDSHYQRSDARRWVVPCPSCGRADWLTWNDGSHWRVVFDQRSPMTARLECPGRGHAVREPDRMALIRAGRWVPTNPDAPAGHRGYHVWAALSPFVTLPGLVAQWLEATARGRETLRVYVNTSLAEPWEAPTDTLSIAPAGGFMAARESYDAIPMPASLVTGAMDPQDDRFELCFVAWGPRDEAWVFEHVVLRKDDPELERQFDPYDAQDWARLYVALFGDSAGQRGLRFRHASGAEIPVSTFCVDSGYHTPLVYRFARFNRRVIYATKGVRELQDGHLIKFSEDREAPQRKGLPLVLINTNDCKQRLADRIEEGRLHFPVADWCHEEFFAQLTAEAAAPIFNPAGVRVGQKWIKQRPRNEVLDLLVGNLAARQIRGTLDLEAYRRTLGLPPLTEPAA